MSHLHVSFVSATFGLDTFPKWIIVIIIITILTRECYPLPCSVYRFLTLPYGNGSTRKPTSLTDNIICNANVFDGSLLCCAQMSSWAYQLYANVLYGSLRRFFDTQCQPARSWYTRVWRVVIMHIAMRILMGTSKKSIHK